nr:MAG TPA: hypothetical protein [Caudoviricetes sp.]
MGMAQGSFSSAVSAWVKETKERQIAVRNLAVERVIGLMQEPGPSMATAAKAVSKGVGLGKVKKDGSRGVSKRAFGPIANPGGSGNVPVDTGFLRASLVVGIGTLSLPTTSPPENATGPFDWDEGQVNLVLRGAKMSDPIEARYTAVYSRVAEYGGGSRRPRRFVALASQQWGAIVDQACQEAQRRVGG